MKKLALVLTLVLFAFLACQKQEDLTNSNEIGTEYSDHLVRSDLISPRAGGQSFEQMVAELNKSLAAEGLQLEKMELLGAETMGRVVFFSNKGSKQLSSDFVPNDPRNLRGITVPYGYDGTELGTSSGMSEAETANAINSAMSTWNAVTCSDGLELPSWGPSPFDVGYIQNLVGFGGSGGYYPGVLVHGGILPPAFFEALTPGGGSGILGVTFTLIWANAGVPTDIDNNGKSDVAIKEMYYNDGFNWQDAPNDGPGNSIIDFETVVLHEAGHGLSQAHFGTAFGTPSNGVIHFSPYALMNAGYTQARRTIEGTDNAGHCENWGTWPLK